MRVEPDDRRGEGAREAKHRRRPARRGQVLAVSLLSAALASGPDAAPSPQDTAGEAIVLGLVVVDQAKRDTFEALLRRARSQLATSGDALRRRQAETWLAFRAAEPAREGHLQFAYVLAPPPEPTPNDSAALLAAVVPPEFGNRLRETLASGSPQRLLTLRLIQDFSAGHASALPTAVAPVEAPDSPASGLFLPGDAGLVVTVVRSAREDDFALILAKMKEALWKSEDPVRRRQAAGWKVFRATGLTPEGHARYVFFVNPAVPDADYSVSKLLAEGFPEEATLLYARMREALAPGGFRLTLSRLSPEP